MRKMYGRIDRALIRLSSLGLISAKMRAKLLNNRIGTVSQNVKRINSNCYFRGNRITIEEGTFINVYCRFFSHEAEGSEIYIGKNCTIAMGVTIDTHTHDIGNHLKRALEPPVFKPVYIGDGCWIGANVTVLPGVRIGAGTVIGGGSVVIHDCEPNCVYAGNPARKIRELE